MNLRARSVAALGSTVLAVTGAVAVAGTGSASASAACDPVSTQNNSSAVVETIDTGATAYKEPSSHCTPVASVKPLAKLNVSCAVYNVYGNYWIYVGGGEWIYAGDLVKVSGTINIC